MALFLALLAVLPPAVRATTDLADCTYVEGTYTPTWGTTIAPWATRTYYLPDTGEICSRPDCGGGRAPVKTDVVGCDSYEGTSIYVPQFLDLESLKLETPSAVLLDGPPSTWTPTVTVTKTLGRDEGHEDPGSDPGSESGQTMTDGPSRTREEGVEETRTETGDGEAPANMAPAPTAGGVVGLVAGAAMLGML
jgi:hypothetical protein